MAAHMLERCIHLAYFDPAVGHVPNPGMGIQAYAFSDHMHYGHSGDEWRSTERSNPNRPLDHRVFERMLDLPYVDNIYFRTDWKNVQNSPGRLSMPPEWAWMMEAVESRGKRWSFRIMNASRHSTGAHSLPAFLADRLDLDSYANEFDFGPERKFYPRYTGDYLKWWSELVHLLAEQYDDHPLLEFVDISGYGIWGEGHHYGRHEPGSAQVQNRHPHNGDQAVGELIEDHLSAFVNTPVAMTLHYLDYEAGVIALDDPRVWLRRDSFQPFASTIEYEATTRRVPGRAVIWETVIPGYGNEGSPLFYTERLPQRFLDFTAHYAAVGFNPWDVILAHETRASIYETLAARVGYRLRPSVVWRRVDDTGAHALVVAVVNDGSADVPGSLTLTAHFPGGASESVGLPTGCPRVGDRAVYTIAMPRETWGLDSAASVELTLSLRMRGKSLPVRWAVRELVTDPFRLRLPLRMPPVGDPFLTPAGAYEPTI